MNDFENYVKQIPHRKEGVVILKEENNVHR